MYGLNRIKYEANAISSLDYIKLGGLNSLTRPRVVFWDIAFIVLFVGVCSVFAFVLQIFVYFLILQSSR